MSDLWLGSIARLVMFRTPGGFGDTLLDRYSRAETTAAKRIAWVVQESCGIGSLPGLDEIMRLAGKLFLNFHGHHESLGFHILSTLSQATQKDSGTIAIWDLDREVIATFSDMVKSLIDRSISRNTSDVPSILKVLALLENTAREILRREKAISPVLLMRPFAEMGLMLESDRYRSLAGREEILTDLRRILAQFSVFGAVTALLVEEGGGATDTTASFKQDLPFTSHRQ